MRRLPLPRPRSISAIPSSLVAALAGASLLLAAQPSRAQTWMPLFEEGKKLSEAGKWAEACPKFAEAHRQKPDATGITLNLADCYKHVGKNASAWSLFKEGSFLAKKSGDTARADFGEKEAAAIEPTLSRLQVDVEDTPGLTIHVDDQDLGKGAFGTPVPVDPGEHKIEATAPGYSVWSTTVRIGPNKDKQTLKIPSLQKIDIPTPGGATGPNPALRPAAIAVGSLGIVGLALGGAMGGLAMSAKSNLTTLCPGNACTNTNGGQDKLASAKTKALVSTVGLSVGGAALATGVVLFVLSARGSSPKQDEHKAALLPTFGPDGGGLTFVGTF